MLVIQHNCRKAYAITIAALETGLTKNADIIYLQELCLRQSYISHPEYIIYWPEKGDLKEKRVATAIRRDLITQTIIEFKVDLINHPYFLTIDI